MCISNPFCLDARPRASRTYGHVGLSMPLSSSNFLIPLFVTIGNLNAPRFPIVIGPDDFAPMTLLSESTMLPRLKLSSLLAIEVAQRTCVGQHEYVRDCLG
jgi:hypothetical protein